MKTYSGRFDVHVRECSVYKLSDDATWTLEAPGRLNC